MATRYPISSDEFSRITGVSKGKALRYGKAFSDRIRQYVEENNIERAEDFVLKSAVKKSVNKVNIIQSIDKKIPLDEIAGNLRLKRDEVIHEIETIVNSGTKLNIDYCIEEVMDDYLMDDIFDYFKHAESDSLEAAMEEFAEDDVQMEDLQLVRIKFISEMAN
jgi:ATP-dependent DNA helicase RecQ